MSRGAARHIFSHEARSPLTWRAEGWDSEGEAAPRQAELNTVCLCRLARSLIICGFFRLWRALSSSLTVHAVIRTLSSEWRNSSSAVARQNLTIGGRRATPLPLRSLLQVAYIAALTLAGFADVFRFAVRQSSVPALRLRAPESPCVDISTARIWRPWIK